MDRAEALSYVSKLITGSRNETHGEPVSQLAHAASLKQAVAHRMNPNLNHTEIEAIDHICTKLSRIATGGVHEDHWLDIIGYAAIALESRDAPEPVVTYSPAEEETVALAARFAPRRDLDHG